jgi:hypothetical protein
MTAEEPVVVSNDSTARGQVAPWATGQGLGCAYNESYTYVQALATTPP